MSWLKLTAGVLALSGLILVGWNGQDLHAVVRSEYFLGNVLVLGAACCWAFYGVGQKVLVAFPGGMLKIFALATALTGAVALPHRAICADVTALSLCALAYLGLASTGLAFLLMAKGLEQLEGATVGLLVSTIPVFTIIEARIFLREMPTSYLLAGAALVVAGTLMMALHQRAFADA